MTSCLKLFLVSKLLNIHWLSVLKSTHSASDAALLPFILMQHCDQYMYTGVYESRTKCDSGGPPEIPTKMCNFMNLKIPSLFFNFYFYLINVFRIITVSTDVYPISFNKISISLW
jgi:hypothetical protein